MLNSDLLPESEGVLAITGHCGEDTGAKVTSRVDSVASLHTKARTDGGDGEEDTERYETRGRGAIVLIGECAHADEQHCGTQEFVEEAADVRHVVDLGIIT